MLRELLKKIPYSAILVNKARQNFSYFQNIANFFKMKIIQKRYTKVLTSKKRKVLEGKRLKVAFFVTQKQLWAAQSLHDEFIKNEYFEPIIVVFPNIEDKVNTKAYTFDENYQFFKKQGMKVIRGYDPNVNVYTSSKNICADIVFYDQPSPQIHKSLLWNKISKESLTCDIPYGYKIGALAQAHFNMHLQNSCWKVFAESERHKLQFIKYGALNGRNVVVSGYPKLDEYNITLTSQKRNFKKIIWAPHWSIGELSIGFSTFETNYKFFLQYAIDNPNIHWVFKPHQRLKNYIVESSFLTQEEVDDYFKQWEKLPNAIFYNDSNYFDIFKDSDALITDCGSFLAEYLPTKKPILHLFSSNNSGYNEIGKKLIKSYYKSTDNKSIKKFINDVVVNENDSLRDERLSCLPLVLQNSEGAGKFIVNYIITELQKDHASA